MRKLFLLATILGFTVLTPAAVTAQNVNDAFCKTPAAQNTTVCKEVESSNTRNPLLGPDGILTTMASILAYLVGFAAIIVIIIAGIQYILSSGDSAKISKAKDTIIYAVIGLIVAVVAQGVVGLVLSRL